MSNDLVIRSDTGGLATLTLNRPDKLNALTPRVFVQLRAHIDAIAQDKTVRCVVLAGNGHAWKHLGVPQIIRANRPDVHVVSVLLLEHEPFANDVEQQTWLKSWVGKADYVWAGPAIQRPDPCLRFKPSK
mgnify:CR=1 FL=1